MIDQSKIKKFIVLKEVYIEQIVLEEAHIEQIALKRYYLNK